MEHPGIDMPPVPQEANLDDPEALVHRDAGDRLMKHRPLLCT